MVRVVPLFVVVMLATIALIVLVSSFVMCVKFLFSNKRQLFGFLLAGFVLAIISCFVLSSAYMLNRRYDVAEHQARVHYQMARRQADLNRQVQLELQNDHTEVQHHVVHHPNESDSVFVVQSLAHDVAISVGEEQAAVEAPLPVTEENVEENIESESNDTVIADESLIESEESTAEEESVASDNSAEEEASPPTESPIDETPSDETPSDESPSDETPYDEGTLQDLEPPVAEETFVAENLEKLDETLAKVSDETPAIISQEVEPVVPEWFRQGDNLKEWQGATAKIVSSSKSDPRLRRLELNLQAKIACEDHAMASQDELGINVSSIHVTDEMIEACQRDAYTVSQPLPGGGFQDTVHQLLVFDEDFRVYVQDAVKNKEITSRLQTTTILSGIVLSSVTFLYGTFSVLAFWRRPKST